MQGLEGVALRLELIDRGIAEGHLRVAELKEHVESERAGGRDNPYLIASLATIETLLANLEDLAGLIKGRPIQ